MSATLVELIRVRASQVNHCACCVDEHSQEAREAGVSERRLAALPMAELVWTIAIIDVWNRIAGVPRPWEIGE